MHQIFVVTILVSLKMVKFLLIIPLLTILYFKAFQIGKQRTERTSNNSLQIHKFINPEPVLWSGWKLAQSSCNDLGLLCHYQKIRR